ncbi:hypothetical protein R84B8_00803 [Treponema sp. R8-4-B8]
MRVFICSYSWFSLAIPMDCVSSIFLYQEKINHKIDFNAENCNIHISLPLLFNCPDANVQHGIILKDGNNNNDSMENRVILFSTAVESEKDLLTENIYPLPKIMSVMQFALIFNGIFFNNRHGGTVEDKTTKELVLLLDPRQLVHNIHKELIT